MSEGESTANRPGATFPIAATTGAAQIQAAGPRAMTRVSTQGRAVYPETRTTDDATWR